MLVFTLIWFGQFVSLLGSEISSFGLGIWVYQRTGSSTQFALISLFATLPGILISPLAGALVDRWSRRWAMIFSDSGAGFSTLVIALLFFANQLEIWQIYVVIAAKATFSAFQWLAYSAATTLLVPKKHLGRASGMVQTGEAIAQVLSPVLAGVLVVKIQIQGIILLDFATFVFSLFTLLLFRFPEVKKTTDGKTLKSFLLGEMGYGWNYISNRKGLLGLVILFSTNNFMVGVFSVLMTPLVLSFASPAVLGTILSIGGIGMLVGSLVMSTWGGPPRLIYGVLAFQLNGGLCILVAGLRSSAPLLALATFLFFFSLPIINGCSQVIWQKKVAPDVQGRVFALRRMIAWSSTPLAYSVAGPLADKIFEPLMAPNGPLALNIGQLIGVGSGRGIGLLFIIMGILTMLATIAAYQYSPLRLVEEGKDNYPNK